MRTTATGVELAYPAGRPPPPFRGHRGGLAGREPAGDAASSRWRPATAGEMVAGQSAMGWWTPASTASPRSAGSRAGATPRQGYAVGAGARAGVRGGELGLDAFVARSRIETLERLPDAGGRREYGLGFELRLGW
ncbi:MAG: hypothetical protein R3F43_32695 [bacterium]